MSVSSSTHDRQAPTGGGSVRDKVVVVTGASSGLGLATAKQLAIAGAEVVMICRNRTRGAQAQSEVAHLATGRPPVLMLADLSVQADVRRGADEIRGRYDHVDILINNAGGAFNRREYSYFGAYRISRLGNVLFTRELARRIAGAGVTTVAVSPGPARTNFGGGGPGGVMGVMTSVMKHTPIFRPADEAAQGIVWAATTSDLNGGLGGLYMRRKQLKLKGAAADDSLAGTIWTISKRQTGIDPEQSAVAVLSEGSRNDG